MGVKISHLGKQSVRALSVDDILPPDSKNYLREAFNAAIKYLSMKGLPRFSAKEIRRNREYSARKWPIDAKVEIGDENRVIKESTKRQLCITGHENGTLRVWSAGDAVMQLLFVIDSRKEFLGFSEEGLTPHPLTIEMCDHSKLGSSAQDTRALPIRQTAWKYHPGYQPQSLAGSNKSIIVQLKPALAVTAVAILSSRHLIAASNEYGFATTSCASR
ncbi:unnamed protein product [Nippostrongylus brasiliensis]|uniref:Lethal(2) giant larvae protein (inferred by orthology to a D. melanogaster protein) n=1 Tax=Nippostrongylus brasiliensis TaxID=27835 RepID=A0A0N4YV43_NIPBR|nr:unnamed protein product [Nippostrongylus brasiliensis]